MGQKESTRDEVTRIVCEAYEEATGVVPDAEELDCYMLGDNEVRRAIEDRVIEKLHIRDAIDPEESLQDYIDRLVQQAS